MTRLKNAVLITTILCAGLVAAGLTYAQRSGTATALSPSNYTASKEWPTYGHDSGGMRFSPLTQITPANVNNLRVAWVYHLKPEDYQAPAGGCGRGGGGRGGRGGEDAPPDAPPAATRGGGGGGRGGAGNGPGFIGSEGTPLIIDGLMYISSPYGRVVALDATTGKEAWVYKLPSGNPATRGVEYFAGDAQTPPQIVVTTSDSKLFLLDAKTGELNTKFGVNGFVTLEKATSSP